MQTLFALLSVLAFVECRPLTFPGAAAELFSKPGVLANSGANVRKATLAIEKSQKVMRAIQRQRSLPKILFYTPTFVNRCVAADCTRGLQTNPSPRPGQQGNVPMTDTLPIRTDPQTGSSQRPSVQQGTVPMTDTLPIRQGVSVAKRSSFKVNYYWVLVGNSVIPRGEPVVYEMASQFLALAIVSEQPMDMMVLSSDLTGYYPDCVQCTADKTSCTLYCFMPVSSVFYLSAASELSDLQFYAFESMTREEIIEKRRDPNSGYNPAFLDEALTRTVATGNAMSRAESGSIQLGVGLLPLLAVALAIWA